MLRFHKLLGNNNKDLRENDIIIVGSLRLFTMENCAWKTGKIVTTNCGSYLLIRKFTKADLRKAVKMSPNTMTKMTKDEEVSMGIIIKIANYLDCDISDMMELVKKEA